MLSSHSDLVSYYPYTQVEKPLNQPLPSGYQVSQWGTVTDDSSIQYRIVSSVTVTVTITDDLLKVTVTPGHGASPHSDGHGSGLRQVLGVPAGQTITPCSVEVTSAICRKNSHPKWVPSALKAMPS
jgi:hypothetical protein